MVNLSAQPKVKSSGINLAGTAPVEAAKISKIQSVVKRTSFIVLGLYLIVFLAVVGTHFFFLQQEKKMIAQGDSLKKEIAGFSSVETLLTTVKNRTSVATNILTNSPQAPEKLLSEIISFIPAGSTITEVNTQEGKFVISIALPNSSSVVQLFRTISSSQFSNIFLDGLSLSVQGFYTVTLSVQ